MRMPSREGQKPIDVDASEGRVDDDGFDKGDVIGTEGPVEGKHRVTGKKRVRIDAPRTKPPRLTLEEVQRPVNTLHPRTTLTPSPAARTHLPISSDDFSVSSPHPKSASTSQRPWTLLQRPCMISSLAHEAFASSGPPKASPPSSTISRRSPPKEKSSAAHDHGTHKSLPTSVDSSPKRSTLLLHSDKANDVDHLLYPVERFEDNMWPTTRNDSPPKGPYVKTEAFAQIKLHQMFVGKEVVAMSELAIRFYLCKFLPSESITIITSKGEEEEIPLNLSSARCNKVKVSLKSAPYFMEVDLAQQSALPVQLMSMCTPGITSGTGWVRFSFAKPDTSKDAKSHLGVLLTVYKCLQSIFGDRLSEALATDMHYSADRWKLHTGPINEDDTQFCADLASMVKESRDSKECTPSTTTTPLQTPSTNSPSVVATRRSSRLICYGNRGKHSMSNGDDIQAISPRLATSHHTDSSHAKPLFVYPEDDPHGILVTTNELARLEPGIYLNDTLVELDLMWIFEDIEPSLRHRAFYFSSFFYRKLTTHPHAYTPATPTGSGSRSQQDAKNELAHRQVRKWTQGINIFERDFLFIPICEHLHWYLVIVVFPKAMLTGRRIKGDQDRMEVEEQTSHDNVAMSLAMSSDVFETASFSKPPSTCHEESSENEMDNIAHSTVPFHTLPAQPSTTEIGLEGARSTESDVLKSNDKYTTITDLASTSQSILEKDDDDDDDVREVVLEDSSTGDHQRCLIICYDSLGGGSRRGKGAVFGHIKNYLVAEAADKLGEEADVKRSHGVSLRGPIQTNSTDCGLFMLQAVETFLHSKDMSHDTWTDKNFTKTNDYSKWFTPSAAVLRRQALRERVMRTAEQFSIKSHAIPPVITSGKSSEEEEDDLIILPGPPTPTLL